MFIYIGSELCAVNEKRISKENICGQGSEASVYC